jgi:uncharacterized membrane protein
LESALKDMAEVVQRLCEMASVLIIAVGAGEALLRSVWGWRAFGDLAAKKDIWRRFAAAIILALEFALAADIAGTAIAPTWAAIGELAAIAAIRTFLNYFLERDLKEFREGRLRRRADRYFGNSRRDGPAAGNRRPLRSQPLGSLGREHGCGDAVSAPGVGGLDPWSLPRRDAGVRANPGGK